ncbi:MAG: 23S rRNA (guanosine(2251)-2'-O)-methyltransferase RlmB [Streptosporangiaceae bacterium]
MSGGSKGQRGSGSRSGSKSKTGKPRPGTGGYGRRRLEGRGPTPPAEERTGHPAQRRATAAAKAAAKAKQARTAGAGAQDDFGPGAGRGTRVSQGGPAGTRGSAGATRAGGTAAGGTRGGRGPGAARGPGSPSRGAGGAGGSGARGAGGAGGPSARGAGGAGGPSARGAGSAPEVVAGRNAVLESLRARVPALALHVGPRLDADDRIGEAVKLAADHGIPVVEAGRSELDRLTGGAIHQGLALRMKPYPYAHPDDLIAGSGSADPLVVALDGITDPRNLGAVARSVAAFGGSGVLVPVRRSAGVTAGAWKASAGALARVPVAQAPNLSRSLTGYAEAGLFVVGLAAGADDEIGGLELADGPLVLVIGSEGKGLSRLVAQQCDTLVRIPISGAESLNAGVAAGIALYEVSRIRAAGGAAPGPSRSAGDG